MASEALASFQRMIEVHDDGLWGPKTLKAAVEWFDLNCAQGAHFFAQCSVETGGFQLFSENLNYSAARLLQVFPKYFNATTAKEYANCPRRIASRVYANRMGNGSEKSEDGWKYRGRGAIQLTGKNNYKAFAAAMGRPEVVDKPELVLEKYVFDSAFWYFKKNKLFQKIGSKAPNDMTVKEITRAVNGGYNGLETRTKKTYEYYKILTNGK